MGTWLLKLPSPSMHPTALPGCGLSPAMGLGLASVCPGPHSGEALVPWLPSGWYFLFPLLPVLCVLNTAAIRVSLPAPPGWA